MDVGTACHEYTPFFISEADEAGLFRTVSRRDADVERTWMYA